MRLKSVLLPTLGRPTMATERPHLVAQLPEPALALAPARLHLHPEAQVARASPAAARCAFRASVPMVFSIAPRLPMTIAFWLSRST